MTNPPWRPKTRLTSQLAADVTELAQHHRVTFSWFGTQWYLQCVPMPATRAHIAATDLQLTVVCEGETLPVTLSEALWQALVLGQQGAREDDRALLSHLFQQDRPWPRGLLLASCRSVLKGLRRKLWPKVALSRLDWVQEGHLPVGEGCSPWCLQLQLIMEDGNAPPFLAHIHASPAMFQRWASLCKQARSTTKALPNAIWREIPVTGQVCLGTLTLWMRDLRRLRVGDVLLPIEIDATRYFVTLDPPPGASSTRVLSPDGFGFWVQKNHTMALKAETGELLWEKFMHEIDHTDEDMDIEADTEVDTKAEHEYADMAHAPCATLADVQVTLKFELGRVATSIGELQDLAPGMIFRLTSQPPGVVNITVGGRRLGRGVMVDVDGALGIELTEIKGVPLC